MTLKQITDLLDLAQPGKRVLIVEDHIPSLLRLKEFWEEAGHTVIAMAGVDSIEGTIASGRSENIDAFALVDMTQIDVVFMDHYFLSRRFTGATLTQEFMRLGQPRVLGMSSDSSANAAMVRYGAVAAIRKADLLRQI